MGRPSGLLTTDTRCTLQRPRQCRAPACRQSQPGPRPSPRSRPRSCSTCLSGPTALSSATSPAEPSHSPKGGAGEGGTGHELREPQYAHSGDRRVKRRAAWANGHSHTRQRAKTREGNESACKMFVCERGRDLTGKHGRCLSAHRRS